MNLRERLLKGAIISSLLFLCASALTNMPSTLHKHATNLSLGADALRSLVLDAAHHDEKQSMDLEGILWLEHINLVVGSKSLAEQFYFDFLGLTKDLSGSFHCNLGQQQFHLAENGDPAQKVTGSIGLVVPSLNTVRERMAAAKASLKETMFTVLQDQDDFITIVCPWGNTMHLYSAEIDAQQKPLSDSSHKMVKLHSAGGPYSASRMAVRGNPGIRYVEIACRPGTAPVIASFYKEMMGCIVSTPAEGQVTVCVGPGVHLVFVENQHLSDEDLKQMEGVHLCIYTAPKFRNLYDRLTEAKLVWTNPRFTHLDSCDTWEEAAASRTLRFKDIIDLSTGEKILELEHETRPSRHGQFLKVPKYEPI